METVIAALALYGAIVGEKGEICRGGKPVGVIVRIGRGRVRFVSAGTGHLVASGPVESRSVERFVESYWYWKKV